MSCAFPWEFKNSSDNSIGLSKFYISTQFLNTSLRNYQMNLIIIHLATSCMNLIGIALVSLVNKSNLSNYNSSILRYLWFRWGWLTHLTSRVQIQPKPNQWDYFIASGQNDCFTLGTTLQAESTNSIKVKNTVMVRNFNSRVRLTWFDSCPRCNFGHVSWSL